MRNPVAALALTFCAAILQVQCLPAQAPAKKTYEFHGKVTAVNASDKMLIIDGDAVPGWMEAMKMGYEVDDPAVLKTIKVGDRIVAKVYDGDLVLHNVHLEKKK